MGFAFKDYSQVWPAIDGELGNYVRAQIAAKAGLVPMENRGISAFARSRRARSRSRKAADLAGLKLRVPGAPALVSLFTALGASPVSMQFGEVYTSLQTRIVDGQENPLSVIDAGKFYEVQKYCAITNHVWDGYWICANRRRLEPAAERHQGDRREQSTKLRCSNATTSTSSTARCRPNWRRRAWCSTPRKRKVSATSCARRVLQGMARQVRRRAVGDPGEVCRQAGVGRWGNASLRALSA